MVKCKCGKIIPMKYFIKTKLLYTIYIGLKVSSITLLYLKKNMVGIDYSHNFIPPLYYIINAVN